MNLLETNYKYIKATKHIAQSFLKSYQYVSESKTFRYYKRTDFSELIIIENFINSKSH
jgi:hypothetical protein